MQDPKPSTLDERGRKSKSHSKRKSKQAPRTGERHSSHKTIADLFGSSAKPLQRLEPNTHELPPSIKRLKSVHTSIETALVAQTSQIIPPERMYNFTTSATKTHNDVIDLTTSPNASPAKGPLVTRKPNGIVRPSNFTPHTGAKRLVVKNLRKTSRASQDQYFDQVWQQLDAALNAIFTHNKVPNSLEELYRGVENLCRQDRAPEVYNRLCERCEQYVSGKLKEPLVSQARIADDIDVLRAVVGAWSTWNAQLVRIPQLRTTSLESDSSDRQLFVQSSTTWTDLTCFTRCPICPFTKWAWPGSEATYSPIAASSLGYCREHVI